MLGKYINSQGDVSSLWGELEQAAAAHCLLIACHWQHTDHACNFCIKVYQLQSTKTASCASLGYVRQLLKAVVCRMQRITHFSVLPEQLVSRKCGLLGILHMSSLSTQPVIGIIFT